LKQYGKKVGKIYKNIFQTKSCNFFFNFLKLNSTWTTCDVVVHGFLPKLKLKKIKNRTFQFESIWQNRKKNHLNLLQIESYNLF